MENTLIIKNMVCGRCIQSVEEILTRMNISQDGIILGEVSLKQPLREEEAEKLKVELRQAGFELIADKNEKLVNKIKSIIIKGIYENRNFGNKNLSSILSEELHFDYSHLSSVFSRVEGKSIQHFQQDIKIERVKELLEYDELSISEIAFDLGYSSAAYLSTQFKRSTGYSPSKYKLFHLRSRSSLDAV